MRPSRASIRSGSASSSRRSEKEIRRGRPFLPLRGPGRGTGSAPRAPGARLGAVPRRGRPRPGKPVRVAPGVLPDPTASLDDEEAGDEVVEERPVVADEEQRARELREPFLEDVEGLDVEIVGRLVEHQQIRRACEQAREQQPVSLAPGQRPDRVLRTPRREQEVLEVAQHVNRFPPHGKELPAVGHRVLDGGVFREPFPLLVEVSDPQARTMAYPAPGGLELPHQQSGEGGLSDSVRPDDPHPVSALDETGETLDDGGPVMGEGDVLGLDHPPSGPRALRETELERGGVRTDPPDAPLLAHLDEPPESAHVPGPARPEARAKPCLLAREPPVEPFRLPFLGLPAFVAPAKKVRIVARPGSDPRPVDLDDPGREPFEERAVVGREHEAAGESRGKPLEPLDGRDVEVVRRLVEEQEIGLRHQGASDQQTPPVPAGERLECGVRFDSGFLQGVVDPPFLLPALDQRFAREALADDLAGRAREPVRKNLRHERHPEPRPALDEPRIGLAEAGEDREERGLAGPVAAGHAHPLPGFEGELDLLEQDRGANRGADPSRPQQRHGGRIP